MANELFELLKESFLKDIDLHFGHNIKSVILGKELALLEEKGDMYYLHDTTNPFTEKEFEIFSNYYKQYHDHSAIEDGLDQTLAELVVVNMYRMIAGFKPISSIDEFDENYLNPALHKLDICSKEIKLQQKVCFDLLKKYCVDRKVIESLTVEDVANPGSLNVDHKELEENIQKLRSFFHKHISEEYGGNVITYSEKIKVKISEKKKEVEKKCALVKKDCVLKNQKKIESLFNIEIDEALVNNPDNLESLYNKFTSYTLDNKIKDQIKANLESLKLYFDEYLQNNKSTLSYFFKEDILDNKEGLKLLFDTFIVYIKKKTPFDLKESPIVQSQEGFESLFCQVQGLEDDSELVPYHDDFISCIKDNLPYVKGPLSQEDLNGVVLVAEDYCSDSSDSSDYE